MAKVELYTGMTWSIPPRLKKELDIYLSDMMESHMDLLLVLSGKEGVGKSFGSRGVARYCATVLRKKYPNTVFGVDDIEFDVDVYRKKSLAFGLPDEKRAYKVNVLDESRKALGRANAQTKNVKLFLDYLSECRAMQQVHIICLPAYHDLAPYIVNWRMPILTRFMKNYDEDSSTHSGYRLKRGEYRLYTDPGQIQRFYDIKYKYPKQYAERTWWSPKEVFSDEEVLAYDKKKFEATIAKYDVDDSKVVTDAKKKMMFRQEILRRLRSWLGERGVEFTPVELGYVVGVKKTVLYNDLVTIRSEDEEGERS